MSVAIVCPECGTRETVAIPEIARAVTRHNNLHHGGDDVAGVNRSARAAAAGVSDD